MSRFSIIGCLLLCSFLYPLTVSAEDELYFGPDAERTTPKEIILKPSKPLSDDYFPCSDCHEGEETNFTKRKLKEEHDDWELHHGNRWCLDCHYPDDRDYLHLADGTKIEFSESWRLCTQCHGKKLADWRLGIHGKRTGYWNGTIYFETCVTCHWPHNPRFKSLEPKPRPKKPDELQHRPWSKVKFKDNRKNADKKERKPEMPAGSVRR